MMAVTAQRTSAQREARLRTGFGMLLGMLVLDSGPGYWYGLETKSIGTDHHVEQRDHREVT